MSFANLMNVPLRGISSMATGQLLAALAQAYHSNTGQPIDFESVGGVDAAKRVANGEHFDLVVLASNAVDQLIAGGSLTGHTRRDLMRSHTGVAVKSGTAAPSIDSAAALRTAVQASASVGYSTGPSGQAIVKLLAHWGITTVTARPKLIQAKPGRPVGQMIVSGEVDIGFQQLSELMGISGLKVLGPMPPGLEIETVFSGAVCQSSKIPDGAQRFLQFLASSHTEAEKRRHGMAPA